MNIIKLVVSVRYAIEDVYKFGFRYTDPDQLLRCAASREMTAYCASATLDRPAGEESDLNRPEALMTYGRTEAARELRKRIQGAVDELDLGVDIRYVDILATHPPAEAAPAYEEVLEAERRKDEARNQAEAAAAKILIGAAGDRRIGWELALAIRTHNNLRYLSELRGDRETLQRKLRQYIRESQQEIAVRREELHRDRKLGRIRPDQVPLEAVVLERYDQRRKLLAGLLGKLQTGQELQLDERIAETRAVADALFARAEGRPAALVAQATGKRWKMELDERARAESFPANLAAYDAAPEIYMLDRWLEVWDEVLPEVSKYILAVDRDKVELWMNLEKESAGLEGVFDAPTQR